MNRCIRGRNERSVNNECEKEKDNGYLRAGSSTLQ